MSEHVYVLNGLDASTGLGTLMMNMNNYYAAQTERQAELDASTLIVTAAMVVQMIIYWNLYDDALEHRDEKIDDLVSFLDELQGYKADADGILDARMGVIGSLGVPSASVCTEAVRYKSETVKDGKAIDKTSTNLSKRSARGIPEGWNLNAGVLASGLAQATAGSLMAGNAKRRREDFITKKVDIVKASQSGMKAVYKASDITGYYTQAMSIWAGLADMYLQGFNSAGAALGVELGKLGTGTSNTSSISNYYTAPDGSILTDTSGSTASAVMGGTLG